MKSADVKIGGRYVARVSGKKTVVRVICGHSLGGWLAENEATRRTIHVRSAQRLREEVPS